MVCAATVRAEDPQRAHQRHGGRRSHQTNAKKHDRASDDSVVRPEPQPYVPQGERYTSDTGPAGHQNGTEGANDFT